MHLHVLEGMDVGWGVLPPRRLPLGAGHELVLRARVRLHRGPDLGIALRQVHGDALGLRAIEGCVHEARHAVALRVQEVQRDGIAVAHGQHVLHAGLGRREALHRAQVIQGARAQAHLVDGVVAALRPERQHQQRRRRRHRHRHRHRRRQRHHRRVQATALTRSLL